MRYSLLIAIISMIFIFSSSCKTSKKSGEKDLKYAYELKRGACFGRCPVFELKIKSDGAALLEAKRFNPINGKFERKLTVPELEMLKKVFKKANLHKLNDTYPTDVADLPQTILTDYTKDIKKSVKANEKMPENYNKAVELMESFVKSGNWNLIEKYEDDKPINEEREKEEYIYEEIIIEPQPGIRLPAWFKDMEKYGIRIIKKLTEDRNLWLITYDTTQYEADFILKMLKEDKNIKTAEFNKMTNSRN